MLNKIKTIFLSRIKHNKEEEWIRTRRKTCLECKFNTLNGGSLKGYRFFLAISSYAYSYLMGRIKEDILGICSICGCSVFYKSEDKGSQCEHKPTKWESLSDGSIKLDVFTERKQKAAINKNTQTNKKNYLN